jgi:hypothetical protein
MPASLGKICVALFCALFGVATAPLPARAQNLVVDSFANASSVVIGDTPGLAWASYHGYNVTVTWDPNESSPGNPNKGAMYVTVNWPGPTNSNYTTNWTAMQFAFGTFETFNTTNYLAFECDIKVNVTNSYSALDGTYGEFSLGINNPSSEMLESGATLAATNGWQHITGSFSNAPGGIFDQAEIELISQGTGTLTNRVSYWIDNLVFTAAPVATTNTIVDSFDNASSVALGYTPGLDWVANGGYDVTAVWDPNQSSPGNPNSGAMYVTVAWPGPSDSSYTTNWTDMLFAFSTEGIANSGIFNSSNYFTFDCDIKVDVTNSFTALNGTYGAVELVVDDPWEEVAAAPLAATNGWQHFTGHFSAIPRGTYDAAVIGLLSVGTGTLTNTVSYWIDNIVFAALSTVSTNQPTGTNQPTAVLTYHNDNARTGQNTNETTLTPATVNTKSFGLLFGHSVDGYVYAQPLVLTNVAIAGTSLHNMVYVVTEHDSVYAFDADSNAGPLWQTNFLNPAAGVTTVSPEDLGYYDLVPNAPEFGITSTPVIDPSSGTIYVEAETQEIVDGAATYVHRLHALDVGTGLEKFGGPVVIQPTVAGSGDNSVAGEVAFDPVNQLSQSALLLANGTVFVAFSSPNYEPPFHGWLLGYNAQTLQQTEVFNTAPNGSEDGIWMGGSGPAVDAAGNIYFVTGSGTFNTNYSSTTNDSLGGSFVKLETTNGLAMADYFRPHNETTLEADYQSLGSAGVMLLPNSAGSATYPHLMVTAGESGNIYLVNRDNLGKFNSAGDNLVVQEMTSQVGPCYGAPAFFNNLLFMQGQFQPMSSFAISNAVMSWAGQSPASFLNGASPVVSANGTNNAVVWTLQTDNYATGGPAILCAHTAYDVEQELYDSTQAALRDTAVPAVQFAVPTVANGKVYVGGQYGLSVFGVGSFTALPTFNPAGGVVPFTNSVTVRISDWTPGAAIYYTLDGTTPTTNSALYKGPLTVTNTVQVNALAVAAGAIPSPASGPALINAPAEVALPGSVVQAFYPGATRAQLESPGFSTPPAYIRHLATFEIPLTEGGNFAQTLTGWFVPPQTGNYVFFVASSADGDLFLSTDATAANAHLIAQETAASGPREWLVSPESSVLASKRSDQFAGTTWPGGNTITLTAGVPYYIRGVQHAVSYLTAYFGATYKLAGSPDPANGTAPALTASVLSGDSDGGGVAVTITNQPLNVTNNQGALAQFSVGVSASYIVDAPGGEEPIVSYSYQWQSAPAGSAVFTNIPNATNQYFIKTAVAAGDNGAQFQVVVAADGFSVTSAIAMLTVNSAQSLPVPVLTFHYDNARTGQNTNEALLTPANVSSTNSFGLLFSYPVDGYIFAQPLLLTNVTIPGMGSHNVVYVVTEHDSIYAFDADSNAGSNAVPLWQVHLMNPLLGVSNVSASAFSPQSVVGPEVGITATPVIDPTNGTLYVVAYTTEWSEGFTNYVHRLHALNVATGNEQPGSPVQVICTNYPGTGTPGLNDNDGLGHVAWKGTNVFNRPALLLNNGVVYVTLGSHLDAPPGHGWILGYDAVSLAQVGMFNTTPNGVQGGLWMAGGGPASDDEDNLFFMVANGSFDTNYASPISYCLSESFVKLSSANGLSLADYFTPYNQARLTADDTDLGMGGVMLLPDSAGSAAHPHLMVGGGKEGVLYLVDRDNLGHYNSANDNQIVQKLLPAVLNETGEGRGIVTPTYFNNSIYYVDQFGDPLRSFAVTNGALATSPASASLVPDGISGSAAISALGTNSAIAWLLTEDGNDSGAPAVLYAFDAYNLAHEFYDSSMAGTRDAAGAAVQLASPTVANGKVYVPCQYALDVYGNGVFLVAPTISPAGGFYTNSVTVTLADVTTGVSLYYTLDGTVPTTNSPFYTGPFALTNSAAVNAIAAQAGAVNSAMISSSFINSSGSGSGTGLTGAYYSDVPTTEVFDYAITPTLTRIDQTLNFDWAFGTPDPSISNDMNFAVRWTGMIQPQYSENYSLYMRADSNVRLWLNGQLLIDSGMAAFLPLTTRSNSVHLAAQQFYNIEVDYYHDWTDYIPSVIALSWSSPSTPLEVVPETQLYPGTNPPPAVEVTSPATGSSFTASASVTVSANAADEYNSIASVSFYANGSFLGIVTNEPYTLTATGLTAGSYTITAVASDTTGLTNTSAPVMFTVNAGTGVPYGLTTRGTLAPFLNQNMPGAFDGTFPGSIPPLLSETGAYANTPNRAPTAGLIPYVPNTPLWSDGATKSRYLALPNNTSPITPSEQIGFAATGQWTFPSGTIFVKNFDLVVNATNPSVPLRRLETRLLVRDTNGAVYGVTYKWRADDSEADLLTNSLTEAILVTNATGVVTQNWYYPSPADCLTCHTAVAGYVLGVNERQLNGTNTYPATGVTDNQIRTMNRLGILNPAFDEAAIATYEYLSSVTNPAAPLEQRVRSYLDANCAQCHQPGGTGATFDARYDTPLTNQNIINTPAKISLGYDNMDVVTPDDVWRSSIYLRMDTTNSFKMPPLARNLIDTNAVPVFDAWINSLPGTPAEAPPTISPPGGTFIGGVTVMLQPPDANATLYYTLDGSLPTTNSLQYTGPFNLTSTATVSANAFETNFINSVAPSEQFTIVPGVSFTSLGYFTNGAFTVQLSGSPGRSFVIQTSADLVDWIPLMTNVPETSPFYLAVPGTTNVGGRFYRAIQLP